MFYHCATQPHISYSLLILLLSVSVRSFVCLSETTHVETSPHFLSTLPVSVTLSFSGGVKLTFHGADTDTDTDTVTDSPNTATIFTSDTRGSSRECRRVVQLATGISSIAHIGRVGEDPREDVGVVVGVGVVEFQLNDTLCTCSFVDDAGHPADPKII